MSRKALEKIVKSTIMFYERFFNSVWTDRNKTYLQWQERNMDKLSRAEVGILAMENEGHYIEQFGDLKYLFKWKNTVWIKGELRDDYRQLRKSTTERNYFIEK